MQDAVNIKYNPALSRQHQPDLLPLWSYILVFPKFVNEWYNCKMLVNQTPPLTCCLSVLSAIASNEFTAASGLLSDRPPRLMSSSLYCSVFCHNDSQLSGVEMRRVSKEALRCRGNQFTRKPAERLDSRLRGVWAFLNLLSNNKRAWLVNNVEL